MAKNKPPSAVPTNPAAESLSKALRSFDADAAKAALEQRADPNFMESKGSSPLNIVLSLRSPLLKKRDAPKLSADRQMAILKVLLEAGADPNLPDCEPAIMMAIMSGGKDDEQDVVKQLHLLFQFSADPNLPGGRATTRGFTALHCTSTRYSWLNATKLLLSHGANVHAVDQQGMTALQSVQRVFNNVQKLYEKSASRAIPAAQLSSGLGPVLAGVKKKQEDEDRLKLDRLGKMITLLEAAEAPL